MRTMLLVCALVLFAGCTSLPSASFGGRDDGATTPPGVEVLRADGKPQPSTFTTAILENGSYQHARLDAVNQTTIVWWNVDSEVHSVVSDDGMFAGSGPIAPNGEYSHTFQTAGDYHFHCRYHADMTGVVVIR